MPCLGKRVRREAAFGKGQGQAAVRNVVGRSDEASRDRQGFQAKRKRRRERRVRQRRRIPLGQGRRPTRLGQARPPLRGKRAQHALPRQASKTRSSIRQGPGPGRRQKCRGPIGRGLPRSARFSGETETTARAPRSPKTAYSAGAGSSTDTVRPSEAAAPRKAGTACPASASE